MAKLEDPFANIRKREKEWDYFMVPYSLREKLERADFVQHRREVHAWAENSLQQLREFHEKSMEAIENDDTPVLQKIVA